MSEETPPPAWLNIARYGVLMLSGAGLGLPVGLGASALHDNADAIAADAVQAERAQVMQDTITKLTLKVDALDSFVRGAQFTKRDGDVLDTRIRYLERFHPPPDRR